MNHTGLRTHLLGWVGAVLTPWLVLNFGVELTTEQQVYVVGVVGGVITSVMRTISQGPDIVRKWLDRRKSEFTPTQLRLLVGLIRNEINQSKGNSK